MIVAFLFFMVIASSVIMMISIIISKIFLLYLLFLVGGLVMSNKRNSWKSFIPIYNIIFLLEELGQSGLMILMFLIPLSDIFMPIAIINAMNTKLKQSGVNKPHAINIMIALFFLSIILPYMAFYSMFPN